MKRKLFLLTAILLALPLVLFACGQKDIGEAKAKEIGLKYINKYLTRTKQKRLFTMSNGNAIPKRLAPFQPTATPSSPIVGFIEFRFRLPRH